MPRKRDTRTEGRILEAAYRLWRRGGERALTMRAVARAAKTTTPTLYARFRDKTCLLELVRAQARENCVRYLEAAVTPVETCRRMLEFAQDHPNEYRLLTADWAVRLSRQERKPAFELIKRRLAEELGGAPEQYTQLGIALGQILHGAACMILGKAVPETMAKELIVVCMHSCGALIEHAGVKPGKWKAPAPSAVR